MYWQSTVSSWLTLKERGIHTRFPVLILGVCYRLILKFGVLAVLVRGSRLKNEVYIHVSQCHSSNRTNRNSTCRVVNKIFHSPDRTNRPNRQACKGVIVTNEMQFSDGEHNMSDRAK